MRSKRISYSNNMRMIHKFENSNLSAQCLLLTRVHGDFALVDHFDCNINTNINVVINLLATLMHDVCNIPAYFFPAIATSTKTLRKRRGESRSSMAYQS